MPAISTRTINVARLRVAKRLFLQSFAACRPPLSLAPMGRSYRRNVLAVSGGVVITTCRSGPCPRFPHGQSM